MSDHEYFMRLAIEVAQQNRRAPFGTVLVDDDSKCVVAQGINQTRLNPLLHGEMDAIGNYAATKLNRWQSLRLYTTAEPCCMCQAAIVWAGIPEVIFGTSIAQLNAIRLAPIRADRRAGGCPSQVRRLPDFRGFPGGGMRRAFSGSKKSLKPIQDGCSPGPSSHFFA